MGRVRAQRAAEADLSGAVQPGGAWETRAARLLQWGERPLVHAGLVVLLVCAAMLVRLPHAEDEAHYFLNHPDEPTYFNEAQQLMAGHAGPLAHGGTGMPMVLELVLKGAGLHPVASVAQGRTGALTADQLTSARVAYLANTLLGGLAVPATYFLARAWMRPAKALVAAALVAFDPFLLFIAGHLMTEQVFIVCVALAAGCVARAQRHPAWLLGMAPTMALACMARGNGVVVLASLALFAVLWLRGNGPKRWVRWLAASVVLCFVLQGPYLAWRAQYLPGPFDYGSNGRFWADQYWNFTDNYWTHYSPKTGGPKETLASYFATHTVGQALHRLWLSVEMQLFDLVGASHGVAHPEGAVLEPLLAAPLLVALAADRSRRELWLFPVLAGTAVLSLTWVYWAADSPRYFSFLIPLSAVTAVEGVAWLGRRIGRPAALGLVFSAAVAFLGVLPVVDGLQALGRPNASPGWSVTLLAVGLLLGVASPLADLLRARAQTPGEVDDGDGA